MARRPSVSVSKTLNSTDANGATTETALRADTTLIDDFNRANGSVTAGAGAAIWKAGSTHTISGNQLAGIFGSYSETAISFEPNVDLFLDCLANFGGNDIYIDICLTSPAAGLNSQLRFNWQDSSSNWYLIYYKDGGGGALAVGGATTRPQADETYWFRKLAV
jgi:hypothetical protein